MIVSNGWRGTIVTKQSIVSVERHEIASLYEQLFSCLSVLPASMAVALVITKPWGDL